MLTLRATDPFLRPSLYAKMASTKQKPTDILPSAPNSHPNDPIPQEPRHIRKLSIPTSSPAQSFPSTTAEHIFSDDGSSTATTATTSSDPVSDDSLEELQNLSHETKTRKRRASTVLVSQNTDDVRRLLGDDGSSAVELIQKACCGGGCCKLQELKSPSSFQTARFPSQCSQQCCLQGPQHTNWPPWSRE